MRIASVLKGILLISLECAYFRVGYSPRQHPLLLVSVLLHFYCYLEDEADEEDEANEAVYHREKKILIEVHMDDFHGEVPKS